MSIKERNDKMSEAVSAVLASPRLKRFTATYAMVYIVISLIFNYIGSLSFFSDFPMSYIVLLVSLTVQAPFMFGCIRGIVTKNYNFAKGLGCFGETDKYPFYFAYIAINFTYEIVYDLVFSLTDGEGAMQTVGLVLSIVALLVRILLNFLVIRIYFDAVFYEGIKPKFSLARSFKGFIQVIESKPGKPIAAEILMWVVGFLSLRLASTLAGFLPAHEIVAPILSCLVAVQFGLIVLTWPIYYLYYKSICGLNENNEHEAI